MTPIYPIWAHFKIQTHNNIITADTFELYFSENKYEIEVFFNSSSNFRKLSSAKDVWPASYRVHDKIINDFFF